MFVTSGPSALAGEGLLPDLADPPELVWHLDLHEETDPLRELVIEDIQQGDYELTTDVADYIRTHSLLTTWDFDDDRAVILPTITGLGSRLHGIDTTSGEVVWSMDPLGVAGTSQRWWLSCTELDSTDLACLGAYWDDDPIGVSTDLYVIDPADGTVTAEVDIGRGEGTDYLTGHDTGAALIVSSRASTPTLARYDAQAEQVWSISPEEGGEIHASSLGDLLRIHGRDSLGRAWTEVLELGSGEPATDVDTVGSEQAVDIDYRDWAGALLRLEGPDGSRSLSKLEDGRQRWRSASEARPATESHIEPGAPVVLADREVGEVVGLDPDTGGERWRYRARSRPGVLLATGDQVVLHDGSAIVSLDATTGESDWRRETDGDAGLRVGSSTLYEVIDGHQVAAIGLATGDQRWAFTAPHRSDDAVLGTLGGYLVLLGAEEIHAFG